MNLFCRAVLVILIDPEVVQEEKKGRYYLQTFKVDLQTTFSGLRENILKFWDLKDRQVEFDLKFLDINNDISSLKNSDNLVVDTYLKGKSNMKKAKFIFMSNKLST